MPISLHLHENFLGFHLQDAHNASLKIQYVFWAVSPLPRSKGMKILRFGGVGGRFLEKTVDFFGEMEFCLYICNVGMALKRKKVL